MLQLVITYLVAPILVGVATTLVVDFIMTIPDDIKLFCYLIIGSASIGLICGFMLAISIIRKKLKTYLQVGFSNYNLSIKHNSTDKLENMVRTHPHAYVRILGLCISAIIDPKKYKLVIEDAEKDLSPIVRQTTTQILKNL